MQVQCHGMFGASSRHRWVASLLTVFCVLTCGCTKAGKDDHTAGLNEEGANRRESSPISHVQWDGRSRFSFAVKEQRDSSQLWLLAVYWGYTRTKLPETEMSRARLPFVGESRLGDMVVVGRDYRWTVEKGTSKMTDGTIRSLLFRVAPVKDANMGGCVEVFGDATHISSGEWTVESSFHQYAQDLALSSVDRMPLKPQFLFLVHLPGLERSGILDARIVSKLKCSEDSPLPNETGRSKRIRDFGSFTGAVEFGGSILLPKRSETP